MIGRTIAHYVIDAKLGEGGWGVVYKGTDTRLHRSVALKFLSKSLTMGEHEQKRFLREARAASSINHPNVCVVHSIEEIDGEQFIVMEFLEGLTLRKWMTERQASARRHLLPVRDVLTVLLQVAHGLSAAHKKGIIHRDVKPENIMVSTDGLVKIMDFGLAKLTGESKLTRSGAAVGTVAYMSPEQVWGGEIDARTDIYSFGVLLYEMLAGTTPFKSDHAVGIMHAIVYAEPEPLDEARPGIDPALIRIVMKCIAKAKGERYASMEEVINELTAIDARGKTVVAPAARAPVGHPARRAIPIFSGPRRTRLRWAVGVVVTGLAAVFLLRWVGSNPQGSTLLPPQDANSRMFAQQGSIADSGRGSLLSTVQAPADSQPGREVQKEASGLTSTEDTTHVAQTAQEQKEPQRSSKPHSLAPLEPEDLQLDVFTNEGTDNPKFVDGETMKFEIKVDKPCTVRCFYLSADGRCYVLTGPGDLLIDADRVNKRVPIATVQCAPPFGAELLHAFATGYTFGPIRTRTVERLCLLDGSLSAALDATRRRTSPDIRRAVIEHRTHITTVPK